MTTRLEKPVTRLVDVRGRAYVVELSRAGVMFREHGHRRRLVAPLAAVLGLAERYAGEDEHREQLRRSAIRRAGR